MDGLGRIDIRRWTLLDWMAEPPMQARCWPASRLARSSAEETEQPMRLPYLPYTGMNPQTGEPLEMPTPTVAPIIEPCKRIPTKDADHAPNGQVIEVAKNYQDLRENVGKQDRRVETLVYITTVTPGCTKGYHGHTARTSTYVAVGGQAEIHVLNQDAGELLVYEIEGDETPYRVIAEPGYFLALKSRNDSIATFIGVPNPPFNADFNEQVELHPSDVEQAIADGRLTVKRFRCAPEGLVASAPEAE